MSRGIAGVCMMVFCVVAGWAAPCAASELRQTTGSMQAARVDERWRSHVIQVPPGRRATVLARGAAMQSLQRFRVIRYQDSRNTKARSGSSMVTDRLTARPGALTHQGLWVDVWTAADAQPGLYWLEGFHAQGKSPSLTLPVIIEVVPGGTRIRRASPPPLLPAQSIRKVSDGRATSAVAPRAPAGTRIPKAAPAVSETRLSAMQRDLSLAQVPVWSLSGQPLEEYDPLCDMNSGLMQQLIDQGGAMPCPGNIQGSGGANATYLLSHSPVGMAQIGQILTINASNLTDPQNVRVALNGQLLQILSATTTRVEARLPAQATTGALIVFRNGGQVLGTLNEAYQVVVPAPAQVPPLFDSFTGSQTQVSWELGYQMGLLSWLSYFDDVDGFLDDMPNFAARLGVNVRSSFDVTRYGFDVCHLASGSMQGVVFEHDASNSVIVAIRGSQTGNALWDWWDNDLDGQPFPRVGWAAGSTIHCGFHQAAKVVYDELVGALKDDAQAGRRIWVTGHSLGGASAMLFAAMLEWDAQVQVSGVYTFGAPGVGNIVFSNAYDISIPNTHRFELQLDPAVTLFHPLHGRPGKNHLLHGDGSTALSADFGYQVYPGYRPASDLMFTHMQYWCRGYAEWDEATSDDLAQTVPVPPPNPDGSGGCDVTDFYGDL